MTPPILLRYGLASPLVPLLMALSLASCFTPQPTADEVYAATFEVSHAPSDEILRAESWGYQVLEMPRYRLYGDGRLVREIVWQTDRDRVERSDEVFLPPDKVSDLIETAIEGGLADASRESLRAKIGGRFLDIEDGGGVRVELWLDSYRPQGEPERSPFHASVALDHPRPHAERFPQLQEARVMSELVDRLESYFETPVAEALSE